MRILLTGANGNLAQAIQRLGKAHEFAPVTRSNWNEIATKLREGDVIIHAASDLKTSAARDPEKLMQSNLMSTVELLKAVDKTKPARFVFISSCAVYGHGEITREDIQPAPISLNGVTKLLNEKLVAEFCEFRKIDYNILRVFNTFGGNDQFSIIHRLNQASEGKSPFMLYNNGLSQRDFIFVEDAAAIVLKLLEKNPAQRILNVGSGEATKIRDIVTEFQKKHPKFEVVSSKREEAEYSRADITRLRELFPSYQFRSVLDFVRG